MPRRHSSGLSAPAAPLPRWAVPLILAAGGFVGGIAIAAFYNVALSPAPPDPAQRAPAITMTGPYPTPAEPARSYPSIGQVFRAPETDGRGGQAAALRKPRASTREERLERLRLEEIMRICKGC